MFHNDVMRREMETLGPESETDRRKEKTMLTIK